MSEVRTYKIKSPLAKQLHEPGGRTVQDATRLAGEELEQHRDGVMASIADTLDELDRLAAAAAPDTGPQVYQLASSVIDLGGFFDTGPLHEAAYSLCDIADRMIGANAWHWPSVLVHLQAMRLIMAGGCRPGRTSEVLLEGLRSISQRPLAT